MNKWKEASSLIISSACKSQISHLKPLSKIMELDKCNFKVLSLKKMGYGSAEKSRVCVFPGGTCSSADSVQEWETIFSSFGLTLNLLLSSLTSDNISKLPILENKSEGIPRWLSLRITAIRETFEECGILLCKNNRINSKSLEDRSFALDDFSAHFDIDEIEIWRKKVLNDPFQFICLCKKFCCYPDVQNLILWRNWLTPSYVPDRFDAVFFLTFMDSSGLLRVTPDYKEIASTQWLKPEELLQLSDSNKIFLKPPQLYEIHKLLKIGDFNLLQKHCKTNIIKCERWMPAHVITLDGAIFLLPGDELYPDETDLNEPSPIYWDKEPTKALRCKIMHRMEYTPTSSTLLDTRVEEGNNNWHSKSKF